MSAHPDPRLVSPVRADSTEPTTFDPLQFCVFATVALLGWLLGPVALIFFATLGFMGYWRARRAGLTRSRCRLRDTRLVLVYLAVLIAAGMAGVVLAARGYWSRW